MSNRTAIPYDEDRVGFAGWRILERFGEKADAEVLESLRSRLPRALSEFPTLGTETINVGILYEGADAEAQAFGYNRLICLPPEKHVSNITLWHELGHIAIRVRYEAGQDVAKTSEEFCSIFSVARMSKGAIDEDTIPYLGEPDVPKDKWPDICRRGLQYREENGANSHYIKKTEEWLEI